MKHTALALCLLGILWVTIPPVTGADTRLPVSNKSPATVSELEKRFVTFTPNVPLMQGSLNLYGYEREKLAKGYPILSPDKSRMAMTEVFFMPDNRQTYSRVFLFPVGRQPKLEDLLPPARVAQIQAEKQQSLITPQVSLTEVNSHAFWDRYQPEKQIEHRQTVFEAGFGNTEPFRVDLVQVVDWSSDGSRLLMIFRPGKHHLGIWRTIPILYDVNTGETVRLSLLPERIWTETKRRSPELNHPVDRMWDIRPLGWSAKAPNDLIVKLVIFEGQSEVSAGFWRYGTRSAQLQYLGDAMPPEQVAHNGWLVRFNNPNSIEGTQTYAPGEIPPQETQSQQPTTKRGWRNRIQFWKKQR